MKPKMNDIAFMLKIWALWMLLMLGISGLGAFFFWLSQQ